MKHCIKQTFVALGVSLGMISCADERLEPYIPGVLSAEVAVSNGTELEMLLNSAYSILNSREQVVGGSVLTDEVGIGFANGGQGITSGYAFVMNPSQSMPSLIWEENYFALARINRVIDFADKITPLDNNEANKIKRVKAEALVLRAYCHLNLLAYFTTDMRSDSALATILADRVFNAGHKGVRATNGAFYKLIHDDLDVAIPVLSQVAFSPILANLNFAKGLKARAYAYKGDYNNAAIWAQKVIDESGVVLADKDAYYNVFFSDSGANNEEVIFKFKRTPNQNAQSYNLHNGWASVSPSVDGSPFYELSRSLHNILNPNNVPGQDIHNVISDVRARVLIGPTSVITTKDLSGFSNIAFGNYREEDKLIINKHGGAISGNSVWGQTSSNSNHNDIKVMRISEMYLILAEARAYLMDYAGVSSALKAIRDVRNASAQVVNVPTSQQEAVKMVLDERRIELAFEGHRFVDIKRLGITANSGIDRHPVDYSSVSSNYPAANPSNMPLTSHKWALPIPQSELNVNPNIVQNPGY